MSLSAIPLRVRPLDFCAINTRAMFRPANLLLSIAALSYIIVIGGATYEHLAFVPQWTAAPPASLAMLQGPYGLMAQNFWIPIHPITLLLMTAALLINWRGPRRKTIAMALGGYVLVLIITFAFFVPELIAITTTPYSATVDASLQVRAARWETMSLVRLAFLVVVALVMLSALTLPNKALDPSRARA